MSMNVLLKNAASVGVAALLACSVAYAQAPADATGKCKDGTYTSAKSERGACSRHGGVLDWYGTKAGDKGGKAATESKSAEKAASKSSSDAATKSTEKATTSTKSTEKATTSRSSTTEAPAAKTTTARAQPAAGGGAGKVWVNSSTKVYHCQGDRWYGKTKEGEYLSESQAKAQGFRPSRGKECS